MELNKLAEHKFENEQVQKAIDLYLISAFGGGLRISDVGQLSQKNEIEVDGVKIIQVHTYKGRNTKSSNRVSIPIIPQLKRLIDKYNWDFPKVPYKSLNDLIRDGFEAAEINRKVIVKSGVIGVDPEDKELHEVVYFHTARYAYITFMMYDFDVTAERLTKITGQSLKVLLGYSKPDPNKNAIDVGRHVEARMQPLHVVGKEAV